MNITYSWIKELTGTTSSVEKIAEELTMLGLEVEGIYPVIPKIDRVVVGEVLEAHPIAGSDHLHACQVFVGDATLPVVCGAPNVAKGQKVPVALVGAKLPGGMAIKEVKLRGVVSKGMICSEKELGISEEAAGIMVFPEDTPVGKSIYDEAVVDDDAMIEISITPNRPDCMGAIGIAREICLAEGREFHLAPIELPQPGDESVEVELLDTKACPRYTARLIRNVKIGPSPAWLVKRLQAIGLRSINNVVDVTNYVMMETGQPLHAFDYDVLKGGKIVVKKARNGEKFTTLDEKEHELTEDDLLICDGERAVALAGIMGGLNSEVSADTTNILLESAYFAPTGIRRSASRLGISTDSSKRFERGVDPNGVDRASNRAAELILQLAGGTLASDLIDRYPEPIRPMAVRFRPQRCNRIIGMEVPEGQMQQIFHGLECGVDTSDGEWRVTAPTFRPDLTREADLIEEIARVVGYNTIPSATFDTIKLDFQQNKFDIFIDRLRTLATTTTLSEVVTFSMVARRYAEPFLGEGESLIELLNPLSEDMAVLRPSLLPSMLAVVAYNLNRRQLDLRFFEVGNSFYARSGADGHVERKLLSAVVTGNRQPESWQVRPTPMTFFDLKGILLGFLGRLSLPELEIKPDSGTAFLEYGEVLYCNSKKIGYLGKMAETVLQPFEIEREVFAFELYLEELFSLYDERRTFTPIPQYPSVDRDLAVVIADDIHAREVEAAIQESAGTMLRSLRLFDVYKGDQIERGKKSLAFSLSFQASDRTLRDEEVDRVIERILADLGKRFDAVLRS